MTRGWGPLAVVLSILVVTDLLLISQSMILTVPIACIATAVLVSVARSTGLSWTDLGLGRTNLGRGLRWGAVAFILVVVGYAMVLLSPFGAQVLGDARTPQDLTSVWVKVLVVIPLRTVLLKEVAFRGVVWAMLAARHSARVATVGSAVAFGLWHIPPAFLVMRTHVGLAEATGGSAAAIGTVLAIVVLTGIAGVVLAESRRRSGSLLAPIGLHRRGRR